jgi:Zn finger protein HypA/HybF involved in hydrogenase expression
MTTIESETMSEYTPNTPGSMDGNIVTCPLCHSTNIETIAGNTLRYRCLDGGTVFTADSRQRMIL